MTRIAKSRQPVSTTLMAGAVAAALFVGMTALLPAASSSPPEQAKGKGGGDGKGTRIEPPPRPISTSHEVGISQAEFRRVRCKGAGSPLKLMKGPRPNLVK